MKTVKILRIDGWLDVVYDDSTYLQFGDGHSIEEANALYDKFLSQPERSKREDFDKQIDIWNSVEIDVKFTDEDFVQSKMRCSEQHGNMLREVQ